MTLNKTTKAKSVGYYGFYQNSLVYIDWVIEGIRNNIAELERIEKLGDKYLDAGGFDKMFSLKPDKK